MWVILLYNEEAERGDKFTPLKGQTMKVFFLLCPYLSYTPHVYQVRAKAWHSLAQQTHTLTIVLRSGQSVIVCVQGTQTAVIKSTGSVSFLANN